jgi:hypothetical protein
MYLGLDSMLCRCLAPLTLHSRRFSNAVLSRTFTAHAILDHLARDGYSTCHRLSLLLFDSLLPRWCLSGSLLHIKLLRGNGIALIIEHIALLRALVSVKASLPPDKQAKMHLLSHLLHRQLLCLIHLGLIACLGSLIIGQFHLILGLAAHVVSTTIATRIVFLYADQCR